MRHRHRSRWRLSGAAVTLAVLSTVLTVGQVQVSAADLDAPAAVATDDVRVKVTTRGNVFDPGQDAVFGVLSARDTEVPWTVRDYRGRTVQQGTAAIDATTREGRIDAGRLPLGYYTVTLRGTDAAGTTVERTAGFAVMRPGPDPRDTAESMFGVNHHYRSTPGAEWDDSTAIAARAGINAARVDVTYWNTIEKPKGTYQFPETTEHVTDNLVERGQDGLYLLGFGNSDYGGVPSTDAANEGFRRYSAAVAAHYADRIPAFEVWNEYYGGFSNGVCSQSAKCYARTLAAAYDGVKSVAPGATVVGASSFKVPLDWFEELFQLGGLEHMDALSIHPYRAPGAPEGVGLDIAGLKELMRKYNDGREIPIWITEQGWTSATREGIGVSEQVQAESTSRALLEAKAAGVAKYYWYDLVNDGDKPANGEHNFGLLRRGNPAATAMNPKPAYLAYATVARELTTAEFDRRLPTGDEAVHAYRFRDEDGPTTTVLWSSDRREDKPVRVRSDGPVEVVDMLGAERVLEPVDGWVYLTLTGEPVFLHAAVESVRESPLVSISAPEVSAAGEDVPVTVTVDNRGQSAGAARTAVFEIEGHRATVSAQPGHRAGAVLRVPAGDVPGTRGLSADVTIDGRFAGVAATDTQVGREPVVVDVSPDMSVVGRVRTDRLKVTVSNRSAEESAEVRGIDWSFGSVTGTIEGGGTVPPLGSRSFYAEVGGQSPFAVRPVSVTASLADGATLTDSDSFGFSPIMRATPQLDDEGQLTGLTNVPKIDMSQVGTYSGITADEADADLWATWDEQNLYVSAVVREKDYRPAKKLNWLPAGESIGIGVQPGKPGEGLGAWGAEWYMLYAGESLEGSGIYAESLPRDYPVGAVEGAEVDVARDDVAGTTTYRVAVPWERIAPLSPDDASFSLTLTVNKKHPVERDNYRQLGIDGWQTWGDGLNNWKLVRYQQVELQR